MATYTAPSFNPDVCSEAEAILISKARSCNPNAIERSIARDKLFNLYYLKPGEKPSGNKGYINKCAFKIASNKDYDFEWKKLQNEARMARTPEERKARQADADQYLFSDVVNGFNNAIDTYDFHSAPFRTWLNFKIQCTLLGIKRTLSRQSSRDKDLMESSVDNGSSLTLSHCKTVTCKVENEDGDVEKQNRQYYETIEISNDMEESSAKNGQECIEKLLQYIGNESQDKAEQVRALWDSYRVGEAGDYAAELYKMRSHKKSFSRQALNKTIVGIRHNVGGKNGEMICETLQGCDQQTVSGVKKSNKNKELG